MHIFPNIELLFTGNSTLRSIIELNGENVGRVFGARLRQTENFHPKQCRVFPLAITVPKVLNRVRSNYEISAPPLNAVSRVPD